ncbi:MAG: DUF2478 domain-containing protein [Rhodobacteraceae bacterium]|nr:DUF2478 domain-containing protein [Paracoccaceae bacterium]
MRIAYVMSPVPGATDRLLARLAGRLARAGILACGAVQQAVPNGAGRRCHMDLRILPDGPDMRISLDRGPLARGCRLDAGALEAAVAAVEARLGAGARCMIVNKFGKHEASGRGFRPVIARALDHGLPVIVGLNPLNREAFDHFAGGLAERLPDRLAALESWLAAAGCGEAPAGAAATVPPPPLAGAAARGVARLSRA